MNIIDNRKNLKEKFVNLPEGTVFKMDNKYYMKTKAMFFYSDIDYLLDSEIIYNIDSVESECQIINAICLDDSATHCHFIDEILIEPVKTELHIV